MKRNYRYDVVVVGGGIAGVAAAVGAAQAGAKTLLIERAGYLGGEATDAGITAFCGIYASGSAGIKVVGGVCDQVLEQLALLGQETCYEISASGNATVKFPPEYLKFALERTAEQAGVHLLYHCRMIDAFTETDRVISIECVDDTGRLEVQAECFIDTTGDANLAYLAGASTIWGNGKGEAQTATLSIRLEHIGECKDISPEAIENAILQAKADGMQNLTKEKGFIIRRGQYDYGYCLLPSVVLENLDAETLTKAELDTRRQAHAYVEAFRRYMPGMENCSMTGTGPTIGIRESRKIEGRYTLSENDVVNAVKCLDGVARGGWKPEIHRDPNKMGEYIPVEDGSYYDIPLGVLQSKSYSNLYGAGRIVSSDEIAFASVRVMGTCFATGQAAGVAAAMQVRYGEVKIDVIRKELLRQGAII